MVSRSQGYYSLVVRKRTVRSVFNMVTNPKMVIKERAEIQVQSSIGLAKKFVLVFPLTSYGKS